MAQISRFERLKYAKSQIRDYFQLQNRSLFTLDMLSLILQENKVKWLLANATTVDNFINFLMDSGIIKRKISIQLPKDKVTLRYITRECSDFEIALSIYPDSFLSHYSAVYIHQLTDNVPKTIYINKEQPEKNRYSEKKLTQEGIDRAFSHPMRKTNQIAEFDNLYIYMLNGKQTGNAGVEFINHFGNEIPTTGIERTLIDIVVRPEYAGGIYDILEAYKRAKDRCSSNVLISLLKKMDYTYPYYQAIGFYMEKAGYSDKILKRLESFEFKYNFYLGYDIKEKEYSERWRLFYPKGF